MKRFFFLFPLLFLSVLSACARNAPDSAVSRAPYFSEIYTVHTLCTLQADEAFPFEQEDTAYLILDCSIQEVLAPSAANTDLQTGDRVLVWAAVTSGQEDALTELFLSADSLIVNGALREVRLAPGTAEHDRFTAQWGKDSLSYTVPQTEDTLSFLDLPPCLFPSLRDWGILPIREGVLDGASLESALEGDVVFSLEEARPEEGLYFQNGDATEDVWDALGRYLSQKDRSLL